MHTNQPGWLLRITLVVGLGLLGWGEVRLATCLGWPAPPRSSGSTTARPTHWAGSSSAARSSRGQGSLGRDATQAHRGQASARLDADFRGGGAYVGLWKDLPEPTRQPDVAGFRCWIRTRNLTRLGVRVVDATGQCHQISARPARRRGQRLARGGTQDRRLRRWRALGRSQRRRLAWSARGARFNIGKSSLAPGADEPGHRSGSTTSPRMPSRPGRRRSGLARSRRSELDPGTAPGSATPGTPSRWGRTAASSSTSSTRRGRWSFRRTTTPPSRRLAGRDRLSTPGPPPSRPTWRRGATTSSSASGILAPRTRGEVANRSGWVPGSRSLCPTMLAGSARWKLRRTLLYRRSRARSLEPGASISLTFDEDFTRTV